ncbi:PREDICTED: uncharacterized protein LOC104798617 [Tarenaya hassleriana]|uniref:uncharacterized protein LOC104798617 n=1 Tax=Tarenaya hassleriana TaxID=28532 RepID=UPI00053C38C6|nr:PREDICTED: uncharacterized protein LOC104798617 [Tarenaya hassleriana]
MARGIQVMITVVFFLGLIFVSSAQSQDQEAENPQAFHPKECLGAIKSVKGCAEGIKGIFHGHFGGLKASCCRTLNGLSDNCWPSVFPGKLWLRVTIKLFCLFKNMNLALPELQEDL